jgi:hypothetical protein
VNDELHALFQPFPHLRSLLPPVIKILQSVPLVNLSGDETIFCSAPPDNSDKTLYFKRLKLTTVVITGGEIELDYEKPYFSNGFGF